MSNWMNEAGEPYMTAAELRFEAELDELSAYERAYDAYDDFDYEDEPEDDEYDGVPEDAGMEAGLFGWDA